MLLKAAPIDLGVVFISDAGFSFSLTGLTLLTINDVLERDPLERPSGVFPATSGHILPGKTPSNFNLQFLRGLFRCNPPTEAVKTPGFPRDLSL